jgi:hypothetical protein
MDRGNRSQFNTDMMKEATNHFRSGEGEKFVKHETAPTSVKKCGLGQWHNSTEHDMTITASVTIPTSLGRPMASQSFQLP